MSEDREKRLVKKIIEKYGTDLFDLEKCRAIQKKCLDGVKKVKDELSLSNSDSEVAKTIFRLKETEELVNNTASSARYLEDQVCEHLKETYESSTKLESYFRNLNELECTLQYYQVVVRIENLSTELLKEFSNKDDEKCVTIFANLTEIYRYISEFPVLHLKEHLKEVILHWYKLLEEKITKDFEDILKVIKWPFVTTNFSLQIPSHANIQRMQLIVEYLLQIEIPEELQSTEQKSPALTEFPVLSLPVKLLIKPLRNRFLYHFYGPRQTNRNDKPEWYFTQILSWIRDHGDFVEKWIQPICDKMGFYHVDAKVEFTVGLVRMAVEKLSVDLPQIQYDDFTFSHCVDEALGFDKELKETYEYPDNQPGILVVLTQAQVFIKWLAMEKKYATEKMDMMFPPSSHEAFEPLASDIEGLKITTCADSFITLIQTIMERYEALPQPGHRLQFLELQLELLDDFRVRLLQIVNAEEGNVVESRIPNIANTLFYVENILVDWGVMLHYLNLYYYKNQSNNPQNNEGSSTSDIDTETVFADTLSLYQHMRKDLLYTLADCVILEVKMRSRPYRYEQWSTMSQKEIRSLSLTPTSCPIFEILATRLHQLQNSLAGALFIIVWKLIARQLDTYLFEELVLENRFSEGGALQLKYDVTRNLFPLFSQFTEKPSNYFQQLNESCILLTVTKGTALLLRETLIALEGATGVEDMRPQALKEIGVKSFTPKTAVTILNRRADITVNRLVID